MTLTPSELKVLKALAFNHYGDSEGTWAWAVNESLHPSGITGKALSGVVGSLAKKGLIKSEGSGSECAILTTAAGKEEMKKQGWIS